MSNIFGRWLGYGIGSAVGKAIFSESPDSQAGGAPLTKARTESEFRQDEKRFAEDEKRIDAESADGNSSKK